jgi:hypothetical protein
MFANDLLVRYQQKEPVPLMAWALLNHALTPDFLDDLFERNVLKQYTRKLLFSDAVSLMSTVVTGVHSSVHDAFQAQWKTGGVSFQAIYDKLNGLEPMVCESLVRESSQRLGNVMEALGAVPEPPLQGYRTLILDGNALGATEHRLEPLREIGSAALPGKSLVILDAQRALATEMIACEDGHAQERSLSDELLQRVRPRDLFIADRNFCTSKILCGIEERGGYFIIREHKSLPWTALEPPAACGVSKDGAFFEHRVRVNFQDGTSAIARRIIVRLQKKTRDGDTELTILTTVPTCDADAFRIAELYRTRWTIETLFQVLTTTLRCEVSTLGYPRAALFVFAVALVASNLIAALRTAIRSVHGAIAETMLSTFYIVGAIQRGFQTFLDGVGAEAAATYEHMTQDELVLFLQTCAGHINLSRYRKSSRLRRAPSVPKKRPPAPPDQPHVSTARILKEAKRKKSSP